MDAVTLGAVQRIVKPNTIQRYMSLKASKRVDESEGLRSGFMSFNIQLSIIMIMTII